jgi:hypothetical protein
MYELRPDLFPAGYLTPDEIDLWEHYYEDKDKRRGGSAKNG